MLFISRHVGQKIVLSDAQTGVRIADIIVQELWETGAVNLGIDAPQTVKITRDSINPMEKNKNA